MDIHVNAGELKERIRIVERSGERNSSGYEVHRDDPAYWKGVHICWAKFSQPSGTETVRAGADFAEEKGRFLIRWTAKPIHRKMFILFRDREWEIEYINDYGGRKYMEIWCRWSSGKAGAVHDSE